MSSRHKPVIIDNLTIRLPRGWQGDPVYLARQISEQIQHQASDLQSTTQISVSLRGNFAGAPKRVAQQFSRQLQSSLLNQKHTKGRGER